MTNGADKPFMRLGVLSDHSLEEWSLRYQHGAVPGFYPYGMEHLRTAGIEVDQIPESAILHTRIGAKLRRVAEHRYGAPLVPAMLAMRRLRRHSAYVAVLENCGLVYSRLRRLGVPPFSSVPLIMINCWLAQQAMESDASQLRVLQRRVSGADMITYWSRNQAEILATRLNIPEDRLFYVPFGVETDFYRPGGPRKDYVLAVGKDHGRDYETLLRAVDGLDVEVVLVCADWSIRGLDIPGNVTLVGTVDHLRYRELLQHAALVVTCVKPEYAYPTGQSVLLQAMACGAPTIVTDTVPLSDYTRDGENTVLVPPRDVLAVKTAIQDLLRDDARRGAVGLAGLGAISARFNAPAMWLDIGNEILQRFG